MSSIHRHKINQHQAKAAKRLAALRSGLLLLLLEEGEERHAGDLHHLEPDTGNVSHGVSLPAEPSDQNLVLHIQHQQC